MFLEVDKKILFDNVNECNNLFYQKAGKQKILSGTYFT